jgi:hypothetical protein
LKNLSKEILRIRYMQRSWDFNLTVFRSVSRVVIKILKLKERYFAISTLKCLIDYRITQFNGSKIRNRAKPTSKRKSNSWKIPKTTQLLLRSSPKFWSQLKNQKMNQLNKLLVFFKTRITKSTKVIRKRVA